MRRTTRRKAPEMTRVAMRSEPGKFSSTVILFCLHMTPVILPATIFVFCIYCLPIQSLGVVKNAPSNDELSYLYAPASMPVLLSKHFAIKYLLHLGTLIYASSIYMQWWCSSCAAVFPSIAVLQYFQVPP